MRISLQQKMYDQSFHAGMLTFHIHSRTVLGVLSTIQATTINNQPTYLRYTWCKIAMNRKSFRGHGRSFPRCERLIFCSPFLFDCFGGSNFLGADDNTCHQTFWPSHLLSTINKNDKEESSCYCSCSFIKIKAPEEGPRQQLSVQECQGSVHFWRWISYYYFITFSDCFGNTV